MKNLKDILHFEYPYTDYNADEVLDILKDNPQAVLDFLVEEKVLVKKGIWDTPIYFINNK